MAVEMNRDDGDRGNRGDRDVNTIFCLLGGSLYDAFEALRKYSTLVEGM